MKSTYSHRYETFLARLRALRTSAGISQTLLAERLERPQSYVSKVEQGQRRLDLVELVEWLEALQVGSVESHSADLVQVLLRPGGGARRRLKLPI